MLKKTRKQILTLGIAGLVGAGMLFSGIASTGVYAQEEMDAVATDTVTNEVKDVQSDQASAENTLEDSESTAEDTVNEKTTEEDSSDAESANDAEAKDEGYKSSAKQKEDDSSAEKETEKIKVNSTDEEKKEAETGAEEEVKKEEIVKANVPIRAVYTVYEIQPDGSMSPYDTNALEGLNLKLYKLKYNELKVSQSAGL